LRNPPGQYVIRSVILAFIEQPGGFFHYRLWMLPCEFQCGRRHAAHHLLHKIRAKCCQLRKASRHTQCRILVAAACINQHSACGATLIFAATTLLANVSCFEPDRFRQKTGRPLEHKFRARRDANSAPTPAGFHPAEECKNTRATLVKLGETLHNSHTLIGTALNSLELSEPSLSSGWTSYRPLTHSPRFWELQTLRLAKGPCQRLGTGQQGESKCSRDRPQGVCRRRQALCEFSRFLSEGANELILVDI
jgi:hypothetical protein